MQVHKIINNYNGFNNSITFQRRLTPKEEIGYNRTINEAKKNLGINDIAMIIHGSSFPAAVKDTGIGSPYSEGAYNLVKFLQLHGFNSCQLGPAGEIREDDISPYLSSVYAKNRMFIDLRNLTTEKYANILSKEDIDNYLFPAIGTKENYSYSKFNVAKNVYDNLLTKAFTTFLYKLEDDDIFAINLNKEYKKFKDTNYDWIINNSIYNVLAQKYGSEDFNKWSKKDSNLISDIKSGDKEALAYYTKICAENNDMIDKNCFIQFLAYNELKDWNNKINSCDFKYINDLLIGFSNADMWANKEAFLQDMRLGCANGGENNGPQYWNIPVLDPKKLFNTDGTLGAAGILLKRKIDNSMFGYDNLRIDHAIGLVNPFIYNTNNKSICGHISSLKGYDDEHNFSKILPNIVLPTLREHGINPYDSVWENLGSDDTGTFNFVYYEVLGLPGITQLAWMRGENSPKNNWALVGSHDSPPAALMNKWESAWDKNYLSGYLMADPIHVKQRKEFKDSLNDENKLLKAKYTELFRSSNKLQISFMDFFGIDKAYNIGGSNNDENWKLRLNNNYEDTYYKSLQDSSSNAINMPEILKNAMLAMIDFNVAKSNDISKADADCARDFLRDENARVIEKLDEYSKILKEKD